MSAKVITLPNGHKQDKQNSTSSTKCPQCGVLAIKPHTPFCSRRCAQIDLGKWLDEEYRVPADEVMDEGDIEALVSALENDPE